MSSHDPTTEQAITEVAEILAKASVRMLEKARQAPSGSAEPPDTTGVEKKRTSPANRRSAQPSNADSVQLPEPPPAPPQVSTTSRPAIPESVRAETVERLQRLPEMNLSELRTEHQRVFGHPAKSSNRQHLVCRIAWEIQAQAEGWLPEEIRQYAHRIAEQTAMFRRVQESLKQRASGNASGSTAAPKRAHRAQRGETKERDPRIPPPGSMLDLKHGRQAVKVTVLQAGFEYAGKPYRSLTAVARQIAGRQVNAYEFFGLGTPTVPAGDS